jgi:hypothetical protein
MLNELDTGSQVGFTVLVCGFRAYGRFHLGPEPHVAPHVARTCLYARVLLDYRTELDLYMEVPDPEHGRLPHWTHESCSVPGDESAWRDNCHCRGRDVEVLECVPEERE